MLRKIRTLPGRMRIFKTLIPPLRFPSPSLNDDEKIRVELKTILASEFFRGSKRCQSFLSFVVEAALSGNGDRLKERTLGVEVFQRSPSYDTGEDAIVRVKANEVRRRLAQYSVTADPERSVRIELQPGSYVPQFHRSTPDAPRTPASSRSTLWRGRVAWTAAFSVVFLVLAGVAFGVLRASSPLQKFWEPVLSAQTTPIICLGDPDVYLPDYPGPPSTSPIKFEDGQFRPVAFDTSRGNETRSPVVIRVPDSYVGIGDSNAGFVIGRTLQSLGRPSHARLGDQVSFSDLKGAPVVLIGAFSNRWTMSMTNNLRFSFAQRDNHRVVIDRDNPSRFWQVPSLRETGKASEDYAIVSRVLNSPSGQSLMCVAGISYYGSQAAAEFITDNRALQDLVRRAPKGWEHMNMQVVLKTQVVNDTPSPAEIVALHFW